MYHQEGVVIQVGGQGRCRLMPWHRQKGKWEYRLLCKECPWQHTGHHQPFSSFEANYPGERVWSDDACSPGLLEYYLAKSILFSSPD